MFGKKLSPQPRPRVEKCRIKTKVHRDGSVTKEISGNCSKDQIAALRSEGAMVRNMPIEDDF